MPRAVSRARGPTSSSCTTTFHSEQAQAAGHIPLLHRGRRGRGVRWASTPGSAAAPMGMMLPRSFFSDRIASTGSTCTSRTLVTETINGVITRSSSTGKVLDASRRTIVGLVDELWDAGACGGTRLESTRPTSSSRSFPAPRSTSRPPSTARCIEPGRLRHDEVEPSLTAIWWGRAPARRGDAARG